ncbi:unnamed protein product, partial [Oppiella nova]
DLSEAKVTQTEKLNKDLPPTYPNGWIPVLESRLIHFNQILNINAFGYELVAIRGQSGRVSILDAFCPHLGANIGVGGKVVKECGEECIRCPFHGWTFRASDGLCVKIPQLTKCEIPTARIKVWESIEVNNTVFVWYNSEGLQPNWFPIEIPVIHNNVWRYEGRTEHTVNCHFQEIPENGADGQHIQELHTPAVMSGTVINKSIFYNWLSKIVSHEWSSEWWPSPTVPHMALMKLNVKNKFFGFTVLEIQFSIRQIGPAFVELSYNTSALGGMDIIIWNNKKFIKNPILTKNERSLVRFRRWFNQFYSETDLKRTQEEDNNNY